MKSTHPMVAVPRVRQMLLALAVALVASSCQLGTDPATDATTESNTDPSTTPLRELRTSTAGLVSTMTARGHVFVFDKDKTLLGGDSDEIRDMLLLIRRSGAGLAVLTSNTSKEGGVYTAIGQLQRRLGRDVFPDSFFRTDAFQVNERVGDRTKADEMTSIIDYFGVRDDDVVFYDDLAFNLADVRAVHPGVVGILVDPARAMTESDFARGMQERLSNVGPSGCKGRCSAACPCGLGEGDCDRDADCAGSLVCPPDGPGGENCEAGATSCDGRCSPACPCGEGEGDCDRDADCAGSLVCPPDGPGGENCEAAATSCDGRCSPSCPCGEGEGDCDRDADCAGSLVCPPDGPGGENCEVGASSCDGRCSPSCPCGEGEGDCDTDADCAGGLVCPPDGPGGEACEQPGRNCDGRCSPACPCGEGEGDCDRDADCAGGLVCPPDGPGGEACEQPGRDPDPGGTGNSNLQIELGGRFRGVCCVGGELEVSDRDCRWTESGRVLETRDVRTGSTTELDCPENGQRPADCDCSSSGERMHGIPANGNVHVKNSLSLPNGAPIFPNSGRETCIDDVNGELRSRYTSGSCPRWRLRNFY